MEKTTEVQTKTKIRPFHHVFMRAKQIIADPGTPPCPAGD
jgi:hypothetical protein